MASVEESARELVMRMALRRDVTYLTVKTHAGSSGHKTETLLAEVLGRCTACEHALFFSHRRDAGRTGRQLAFIAPRPPTGGGPLP